MRFIQKHRNILDFTLASLFRRKGKNISLLLVYTVVIFSVASILLVTHAIKQEALLVLQGAPEIIVQRLVAGRQDVVPLHYADMLRGIRGVQSVTPRLWGYYYDPTSRANYTVIASDDLEQSPGMIAVGSGVARVLAVNLDGTAFFKNADGSYKSYKIKGVMGSNSELESADLVLMNAGDFRTLFNYPRDRATDLVLKVKNPKELTTIAAKIARLLPDSRPILRDELLRTYEAVFSWRGGMVVVVLAAAILAFIILAWDKATGLSAEERREIGVLKALGWETSDVLLMKAWEGAVISVSAFLIGMLLAYLHVFFTSAILFEPAIKGWSVLYPDFKLTPFIDAYQLATVFFLTVVPYTVATIVPSWRAATIDPDSVMRA